MGLVLELWDNFEFFADVPTYAMGMAMPMPMLGQSVTKSKAEA